MSLSPRNEGFIRLVKFIRLFFFKIKSLTIYFLCIFSYQNDFYGNIFGILAAHPITPLVSLHHYKVTNAIFPRMDKLEALEKLRVPAKLDSAALMQQSICYDAARNWTISVSWGYAVQIIRGILHPREIEMIARTFYSWYQTVEREGFIFNNRPYYEHVCQKPFVHFFSNATYNSSTDQTLSEYIRHDHRYPRCDWKMADPLPIARVEVLKRPDPYVWDRVRKSLLNYLFYLPF